MSIRSNIESRRILLVTGWALTALFLVALRIPHLGGPLDDPHSWRQCDTAYYTLDFYRHGIDLLHPAVCWLGAHRTLIFEFPLAEALSALLYRAFGPDPMWDRVVSMAFFLAATVYLYAFVRLFATRRVAWLAALAYLAFPLGQFYSRAAHVDFVATAFATAWLYHATVAVQRDHPIHAAIAAIAGALAAMIKMPYLIPMAGPFLLVVLGSPRIRGLLLAGASLAVTGVAFVLWRRHVDAVNATTPDWSFIPGFYKEVNPLWWYIGEWSQRQETASWIKILRRIVLEVVTPIGALIAAAGLFGRGRRAPEGFRPSLFALLWTLATVAYLLVFFPLNVIHSYYQIPFLAPLALWIALGADLFWERAPRLSRFRVPLGVTAFVVFVLSAVATVVPLGYYRIDWLRVEAGKLIADGVPKKDLVVVSDHDSGWSDPRLLFRADHDGWPIAMRDLGRERLERLASLGARWVAVVTDPEHPGSGPPAYLERGNAGRFPVMHAGRAIGTLSLYDLGRVLGPDALEVTR